MRASEGGEKLGREGGEGAREGGSEGVSAESNQSSTAHAQHAAAPPCAQCAPHDCDTRGDAQLRLLHPAVAHGAPKLRVAPLARCPAPTRKYHPATCRPPSSATLSPPTVEPRTPAAAAGVPPSGRPLALPTRPPRLPQEACRAAGVAGLTRSSSSFRPSLAAPRQCTLPEVL